MTENVVFIVAGKDKAGMWNLMFSGVIGNKVALTTDMVARFVEVTVLAVDSKEVVDKATIDLEQVECIDNDEHVDVDDHMLEIEERDNLTVPQVSTRFSLAIIFYCSSLVILIVILIILVGIIFIKPSYEEKISTNDADSVGEIINDAFLPCASDFDFVDSESEKQFYKFF